MLSTYTPGEAYTQTFLGRFVRLTTPFHITGAWSLGTPRKPPAAATVEHVYARDGLTCALCGLPGQRETTDPWALNLDHVIPHSLRGPNHETNLRVSHRWCNAQRQLIPYPETIMAADGGRCRRCGGALGTDTLIEHLVELTHPAMWDERCAWPCHRACHHLDSWPEVPIWAAPRLPNLLGFLTAPFVLVQNDLPTMLVQVPTSAPAAITAPPSLLPQIPVRVRRQEEVISLQWLVPGRFTLSTVLTLDEARALARDLLIESCVASPPPPIAPRETNPAPDTTWGIVPWPALT